MLVVITPAFRIIFCFLQFSSFRDKNDAEKVIVKNTYFEIGTPVGRACSKAGIIIVCSQFLFLQVITAQTSTLLVFTFDTTRIFTASKRKSTSIIHKFWLQAVDAQR